MKKIIMLLMLLALSLSIFSCGGGAGSADTPKGENPGIPSVVKLTPSHFIAQTNSFISLHAKVLDGNGAPVSGVPVTFTNLSDPFGKISIKSFLKLLGLYKQAGVLSTTTVKTNGLGIATVKLSSTIPGFATIQAEVNKGVGLVRDKKTVFFTTAIGTTTPPSPIVTIHVDDGDGIFDEPADFDLFKTSGDNQRTIKAVVLDGFGSPMSGVKVSFGSDSPDEVTFTPSTPVFTTSSGEAFVTLTVNPSIITNLQRVLNITAAADTNNDGTFETASMVTLFLEPVTVSSIAVTANPQVVSLNGTSTILASVILNTGGPAPDGSTVSFTTTCGTVTPFAQTTGGVATATFTAPSIPPAGNICTVTATIGGNSGTADITVTTSLTVQPNAQTINGVTGGSVVFAIFGGTPGYRVTSSNPGIAFNTTPGNGIWDVAASGGTFTVTVPQNTPQTTVTLTIRDQIGTTISATLTIGGGTSLSVQPGTQTIDGSSGGDATFTIFGGAPGYVVFANTANPQLQPDPSSVAASGGTFTIHVPASTPATTVIYTVRDSLGATTTATLTITAAAGNLLILPGTVSVIGATGDTVSFTVSGGTSPYVITSTDPANAFNTTAGNGVWNVAASGGTFDVIVPAGAPNETITLNVFDSVGGKTSATIIITGGGAAGATLSVSPASVSVTGMSDTSDQVTFVITGGSGTYSSVVSDNTAVIPPPTVSFPTFTINPNVVAASTGVTLTVIDSLGATKTATVTVTPATSSMAINPSTIAVAVGDTIPFHILGGFPSFNVFSSDGAVVNFGGPTSFNTSAFTFNANAVGSGAAIVTVVDSDGKTVTANVTVTGPPPPAAVSVAPPTATICENNLTCSAATDVALFVISGGTPPYTVTSLTPSVILSPGLLAGNFFTVDAINGSIGADTPVILTVQDSAAGFASVTVTVINQP